MVIAVALESLAEKKSWGVVLVVVGDLCWVVGFDNGMKQQLR